MPYAAKRHRTIKPTRSLGSESRQDFYSSRQWRRFRLYYLALHPLCVVCGEEAKHVDHIESRAKTPEREYDESNMQAMCVRCHSRKTRMQDMG